jgi:hypothetical protein
MNIIAKLNEYTITEAAPVFDTRVTGTMIESEVVQENSEIEKSLNKEPSRWKNFLRSHVPYVLNGYIVQNLVSKDVRTI